MTTLTLGQAAKLSGHGKTTLARAIKRGALSASRNETGGYMIDPAELARVYPFPAPGEAAGATNAAPGIPAHRATDDATSAALTAEVTALREMLTMMREQTSDLREDRDRWRACAERLALTAPKPERSLWRWLRSTG